MSDLPIIFSAPMIRGLIREAQEPGCIDGKTMTRRLLYGLRKMSAMGKNGPTILHGYPLKTGFPANHSADEWFTLVGWHKVKAGDRLYVRETLKAKLFDAGGMLANAVAYADDTLLSGGGCTALWSWSREILPSIHMPRAYSRLTLIVTAVKIERLQDITEADARAEGCGLYVPGHGWVTRDALRADPGYSNYLCARLGFQDIWQTLHGADSWDESPWVVAISFRPVLANIDSLKEQAI